MAQTNAQDTAAVLEQTGANKGNEFYGSSLSPAPDSTGKSQSVPGIGPVETQPTGAAAVPVQNPLDPTNATGQNSSAYGNFVTSSSASSVPSQIPTFSQPPIPPVTTQTPSSQSTASQTQSNVYSSLDGVDPNNASEVRSAASGVDTSLTTSTDPVTSAVNDTMSSLLTDIGNYNNMNSTAETVQQYTLDESNALGIPAMNTSLMNIDNLIYGNEDSIRSEITAAHGVATESQIEGMASVRNKVLQQQASTIQNSISNAENNLSLMSSAYGADKDAAIGALKDKISNDNTVLSVYQGLQSTALSNYKQVMSTAGATPYAALVSYAGGNKSTLTSIEDTLGLQPGVLSNPQWVSNQDALSYKAAQLADTRANIVVNEDKAGAQESYYGFRDIQSANSAASDVVSNYTSSAGYTQFVNAQPIMSRIDDAANNPGSVSDAELVRAFGALTNVNTAVTDSEASQVSGGTSILQDFDKLENKVTTQGGSLSQDQRDQIITLSQAIYSSYKGSYTPIYNSAINALNDQNLPTGVLPNPNTYIPPGGPDTDNGQSISLGGNTYVAGQNIPVGNGSMTVQPDGSLLGSNGVTYDIVNGQPVAQSQ